jgi:hypothetical protein
MEFLKLGCSTKVTFFRTVHRSWQLGLLTNTESPNPVKPAALGRDGRLQAGRGPYMSTDAYKGRYPLASCSRATQRSHTRSEGPPGEHTCSCSVRGGNAPKAGTPEHDGSRLTATDCILPATSSAAGACDATNGCVRDVEREGDRQRGSDPDQVVEVLLLGVMDLCVLIASLGDSTAPLELTREKYGGAGFARLGTPANQQGRPRAPGHI